MLRKNNDMDENKLIVIIDCITHNTNMDCDEAEILARQIYNDLEDNAKL